jgi:resolvase-like protein
VICLADDANAHPGEIVADFVQFVAGKNLVNSEISTGDQNPDLQRNELPEHCQRRGWILVETYEDHMSGAKDRRPNLDRLLADVDRTMLFQAIAQLAFFLRPTAARALFARTHSTCACAALDPAGTVTGRYT